MKWECPCCGYYTLKTTLIDSLGYICPVCFWEMDTFIVNETEQSDQNHGLTLLQAQDNFIKMGACCKEMICHVRPPNEEERTGPKERHD
ncbi:MAG: CPCC family cysteine-rich protein [Oscillospiraceae bacterium]